MGYGSKDWQDWVLDEEDSLPLIEHAYKRGINTWDTARSPPNIKHIYKLTTQ
jgi:aryl-alcohol dehydrogenase-like predicted oxidoreductase